MIIHQSSLICNILLQFVNAHSRILHRAAPIVWRCLKKLWARRHPHESVSSDPDDRRTMGSDGAECYILCIGNGIHGAASERYRCSAPMTVLCAVVVLVCGIFAAADFKEILSRRK